MKSPKSLYVADFLFSESSLPFESDATQLRHIHQLDLVYLPLINVNRAAILSVWSHRDRLNTEVPCEEESSAGQNGGYGQDVPGLI
ncbi:hypothetical protein PoB_006159900 [Plakobranchus ocellatus]|uniref:Uncharacterized protein n=1 Tax=Plakobranchus ocellatus TaxID=259542 RepID=A0AAV4CT96_9GAST|nr:hypothetical protein PoB_006159900 [Plakobranchus ocellatus]